MSTIVSRIEEYLALKRIAPNAAEKAIGVANGTLSKPINDKKTIRTNTLEKFLSFYSDINPFWLTTGNGTILNDTKDNSNYRMPSIITVLDSDREKENIEIVPVKLAAGYIGGGYRTNDFIKNLPKFRLPYLNNGTFRCFQIEGHSMANGVKDTDWFIGRFTENLNNFAEGKIHAVIAPGIDSLLIKRVFRHPQKKGTLLLRSDNNDELMTYSDIEVNISDITEMWSYTAIVSFIEPTYDAEKFKKIVLANK